MARLTPEEVTEARAARKSLQKACDDLVMVTVSARNLSRLKTINVTLEFAVSIVRRLIKRQEQEMVQSKARANARKCR